MPEPLQADLELSITSALSTLDELRDQVEQAIADGAATGIDALSSSIDAVPPLTMDADFGAATEQLDLFNADATTPVVLPLDADTEGAVNQLDLFTSYVEAQQPAPIPIEVDTSDAEQAIADLGDTTTGTTSSLDGLQTAASGVQATTGLATGSSAGLGAAIGSMGGRAGVAVGVVAALSAGVGVLFKEGLSAEGSIQRFNARLGDSAGRVEALKDLDDLNSTLGELALNLGTDDDALRQVVATQYQLATGSGVAAGAAATYTEGLAALAARAVALNPNLGGVDNVATSLGTALSRGGRFAARFGLDLSTAQISARALEDTGKSTAAELTFVEKSMAGAALAAEKYGQHLERDIAGGSENPIIQQRVLKQAISENIEAAGKPLVIPILDLMDKGVPIFAAAGKVIGVLGQTALPILSVALEALLPFVQAFADGLEMIGPTGLQIALALLTVYEVVSNLKTIILTARIAMMLFNTTLAASPWGWVALGVGAAVAALGLFGGAEESAADSTQKFTDAMVKQSGVALIKSFSEAIGAATIAMLKNHENVNAATLSHRVFRDIAEQNIGVAQRLADAMYQNGEQVGAYELILAKAERTQQKQKKAQDETTSATDKALGPTVALTSQFDKNTNVLVDMISVEKDEVSAKQKQTDALLSYVDALRAQEDKHFAVTKALKDLQSAEEDEKKANEDSTSSQLDKQIAYENTVTKAKDYARTVGEAAAADNVLGSAADKAASNIDAQILSLEETKKTVEPGSPLWNALTTYQDLLRNNPTYLLTHLDLIVSAYSGVGNDLAQRQLDAYIAGKTVPTVAVGAVIPATPGGQLVRVAEAGHDEIVVPTDDRARAIELLRQGGLGDLLGAPPAPTAPMVAASNGGTDIDYDKLAATIAKSVVGQRPLIGEAHFGDTNVLADLDYFHKTRMAGV